MGRKRKDVVKKTYGISVDPELWKRLEKDGVNRSRLFSISARIYLKRKGRKKKRDREID